MTTHTTTQFKNGDRVRLSAVAIAKRGYNKVTPFYSIPDRLGVVQSLRPQQHRRRETVKVLWDGRISPTNVIEADLELAND